MENRRKKRKVMTVEIGKVVLRKVLKRIFYLRAVGRKQYEKIVEILIRVGSKEKWRRDNEAGINFYIHRNSRSILIKRRINSIYYSFKFSRLKDSNDDVNKAIESSNWEERIDLIYSMTFDLTSSTLKRYNNDIKDLLNMIRINGMKSVLKEINYYTRYPTVIDEYVDLIKSLMFEEPTKLEKRNIEYKSIGKHDNVFYELLGHTIPEEVIGIVFSYIKKDLRFLNSVGVLNERFYILALKCWEVVKILPKKVFGIPLLVLRNAKVVRFNINGMVDKEVRHVIDNIKHSVNALYFSGCNGKMLRYLNSSPGSLVFRSCTKMALIVERKIASKNEICDIAIPPVAFPNLKELVVTGWGLCHIHSKTLKKLKKISINSTELPFNLSYKTFGNIFKGTSIQEASVCDIDLLVYAIGVVKRIHVTDESIWTDGVNRLIKVIGGLDRENDGSSSLKLFEELCCDLGKPFFAKNPFSIISANHYKLCLSPFIGGDINVKKLNFITETGYYSLSKTYIRSIFGVDSSSKSTLCFYGNCNSITGGVINGVESERFKTEKFINAVKRFLKLAVTRFKIEDWNGNICFEVVDYDTNERKVICSYQKDKDPLCLENNEFGKEVIVIDDTDSDIEESDTDSDSDVEMVEESGWKEVIVID